MTHRWIFNLAVQGCLLALLLVAISCSGATPNQVSLPTDVTRSGTASFTLAVLDETFIAAGQAEAISLKVVEGEAGTTVEIHVAGADGLKAVFFELSYDKSSYTPVLCETTNLLGSAGETLSVSQLGLPGIVAHGQVLQHYDTRPGFQGSGKLASIRFSAPPFARPKLSSSPPASQVSAPQATWDEASNSLGWDYANQGDYDQNGEVNIADLTPIALHFGESGDFARNAALSVVDGDGNGEINLADITPLAVNYANTVTEYGAFFTNQQSMLPADGTTGDGLYPLLELPFATATGDPKAARLAYSIELPELPSSGWIWIQPLHDGQKGTASNIFEVGDGVLPQDIPPVAAFQTDADSGNAPLDVQFDAAGSHDPDGTIAGYEWNWDSAEPDSEWSESTAVPNASHTFSLPGTYTVLLRVTDNDGLNSVAQQVINVLDGPNQIPVASLVIDGEVFLEKHLLELDASGSFDPDGEIVSYDWDYDGDGDYDQLEMTPEWGATRPFAYQIGEYNPTVRVWDSEGAAAVASLHITVIDDLPPVVVLDAAPLSGTAPFSTFLSAIGTYDPEGELDQLTWRLPYEWIRDGNVFDNHGRESPIEFNTVEASFYFEGTYECSLSATDLIGQTTTATVTVTVDSDFNVSTYTVEPWYGPGSIPSVADIAGYPCIAILKFTEEADSLLFYRASDFHGTQWEAPVVVKPEVGLYAWHASLADIGGHPAITWSDYNPNQISYCRALDAAGTQWGEVIKVGKAFSMFGGGNALAEIDGFPAIAYTDESKIIYRRATDVAGDNWSDPVTVDQSSGVSGTQVDLAEYNGLASVVYSVVTEGGFTLRVANLLDAAGSSINYSDLGGSRLGGNEANFGIAEGRPSVISDGMYFLADDSSGHTWSDPIELGDASGNHTALGSLNGQPVGFVDHMFVIAKDHLGLDWYRPWGILHTSGDFDAVELNGNLNVAYLNEDVDFGRELAYMVVSQ